MIVEDYVVTQFKKKSWQQARERIVNQNYDEALTLLEPLVQQHFDPELWLDYAQVLLKKNRLEQAQLVINTILARSPSTSKVRSLQAQLFYKCGYYQKALQEYESVLANNQHDQACIINTAYCLCQLGRFEDALTFFEQSEQESTRLNGPWVLNYAMALLFSKQPKEALPYFKEATKHYPQDAQLLFHFGLSFDLLGEDEDAKIYYQQALKYDDQLLAAHHNLAIMLSRQGNYQQADEHLKIIAENDHNNTIAKTLLAAHRGDSLAALPNTFIQTLFDQYAFNYDQHLKEGLNYQAPALARSFLHRASEETLIAGVVIDLGCGTGLMGKMMRDVATQLIGIDLSSGMLKQAQKTELYNQLIEQDIITYLSTTTLKAQYITAIEVLNYLGTKTEQLIKHARERLLPGGWLVITAELSEQEAVEFNKHARYSYSQDYLTSLLLAHGFTIKIIEEAPLRLHEEKMIGGLYFIATLSE
jgi:predicted TPR repeat methyltransferase